MTIDITNNRRERRAYAAGRYAKAHWQNIESESRKAQNILRNTVSNRRADNQALLSLLSKTGIYN